MKKTNKVSESKIVSSNPSPRGEFLSSARKLLEARNNGELQKLKSQIESELMKLEDQEVDEINKIKLKFADSRRILQTEQSEIAAFL